jgi:MFS family permease
MSVRMARIAVTTVFAFNGVIVGSWTSRVPAVAGRVHADPGSLGLALLGSSVGLIIAAPLASRLCARFGARLLVPPSVLACCVALALVGAAPDVPLLGCAMFLVGTSIGALDVSMNIAAVSVIRGLDRPLMPTFHGAYSFGALGGGLVAGLAAAIGWSPLKHFLVVVAVGVLATLAIARHIPGDRPARTVDTGTSRGTSNRFVPPIRRPALWLMASLMLCSAVAEGANGDWSALFLVHQRHVGESVATIGYASFNVAMATARLLGERWERRWGPYRLLAGGAGVAAVGMFGVVLVPWLPASYLGFAMAGAGLAFSFPVTLGLAGAAGRRADGSGGEREIGFVTTIAYTGFLAGPPMIGAVAQATNLTVGLGVAGVTTALVVPAALLTRRARGHELRSQEFRAQSPGSEGLAEAPERQGGPDDRDTGTGGQRREHAGTDRQVQREVP